jgi:hypothetical protein
LDVSFASLEYSLQQYLAGDGSHPFSLKDVTAAPIAASAIESKSESKVEEVIELVDNTSLDVINSIPEFASLGEIYKYVVLTILAPSKLLQNMQSF